MTTLKTVIQTEPCVQYMDLDDQRATRDRRPNKNMKLWIKTCSGSNGYNWITLFFLPKGTESHQRLEAERFW